MTEGRRWCVAAAAALLLCVPLGLALRTRQRAEGVFIPEATTQIVQNMRVSEVVVTSSGKKYHRSGCGALAKAKSVTYLSFEEARMAGYEPCARCLPDGSEALEGESNP